MSTVEQIPRQSIESGVPFDWDDLASYCDRLDRLEVLINHAFQVGHVPLRSAVLGVPGAYTRPASAEEVGAMGRILRQGLELGALGFSTDQVIGNPGPDGTSLPGQICGEEELLSLAGVLGGGRGRACSPWPTPPCSWAGPSGRPTWSGTAGWPGSGRPVVVGPVFGSHEDPGGGGHHGPGGRGTTTRGHRRAPDLDPAVRAVDPSRTVPGCWSSRSPP